MDVIKTLKKDMKYIQGKFKVKRLGVFGSFANGSEKEDSDVDILVEFSEPVDLFHFIDLKEYLEKRLDRNVDLATPKALKPLIREHILSGVVNL